MSYIYKINFKNLIFVVFIVSEKYTLCTMKSLDSKSDISHSTFFQGMRTEKLKCACASISTSINTSMRKSTAFSPTINTDIDIYILFFIYFFSF